MLDRAGRAEEMVPGHALVKDRHATQVAAGPFGLVLLEIRIDGLEERPHEGDLEPGSRDRAFLPYVADCS